MRATLQGLEKVMVEEGWPSGVLHFHPQVKSEQVVLLVPPLGVRGSATVVSRLSVDRPVPCPHSCISATLSRIATLLLLFPLRAGG